VARITYHKTCIDVHNSFLQHFIFNNASTNFISHVAVQSIKRKRVLERSCRLAHLSVSVRWINCGNTDLDAVWGGDWVGRG